MNCQSDWLNQHIENALNHFGRTTEPKKVMCDQAWYKDYDYRYNPNGSSRINHRFVNDLLGQRVAITEQQYDSTFITNPNQIQK